MNNLGFFRETAGLTKKELASLMNVTVYTYSGFEDERMVMSREIVILIAKIYGISFKELTYIVMFTVVAPIVLIVSLSGIGFLMKKDITTFYAHNNCLNWKKEAVFVLIPGELIRAFLCMTKLGAVSTVLGKLSVLTTAIYQTVYLSLTGRLEEILNNSTYVFYAKDYFAFMTCHLMYMFFYFPFVVYIYLRCCRRGTMERQDLDLACR